MTTPGTFTWPPTHTIRCPRCAYVAPWQPQPVATVVICGNRELTGALTVETAITEYRPQRSAQMYATTDRERVWVESYHVDGDDDRTTEVCGRRFTVAPVRKAAA